MDVVRLLLDAGADVNIAIPTLGSALGSAKRMGHAGVVEQLLTARATEQPEDAGLDMEVDSDNGEDPKHSKKANMAWQVSTYRLGD